MPRRYGTSTFKLCFVGSAMATWLVSEGIAYDRAGAVDMCRRLQAFGFIAHVCDDHDFKDEYLVRVCAAVNLVPGTW